MEIVISCDIEIVSLLKTDKRQALEAIYKKYGEQLYSFIYQRLNSEALSIDALKQTFTLVWKYADTYHKTPACFFVWLLGVAKEATDQIQQHSLH